MSRHTHERTCFTDIIKLDITDKGILIAFSDIDHSPIQNLAKKLEDIASFSLFLVWLQDKIIQQYSRL